MPTTYSRRRRGSKPERRRALELLAASPDGCSEAIMLAHGFTVDFLVELIRTGWGHPGPEGGVVVALRSTAPALPPLASSHRGDGRDWVLPRRVSRQVGSLGGRGAPRA